MVSVVVARDNLRAAYAASKLIRAANSINSMLDSNRAM